MDDEKRRDRPTSSISLLTMSPTRSDSTTATTPKATLHLLLPPALTLILFLPMVTFLWSRHWFPVAVDPGDLTNHMKSHNASSAFRQDAMKGAEVKDKLLGGLLSSEFDEGSCLSRYQSILLRKASPYKPSSHLLKKLRDYESLHKKCGPRSELYKRTANQLKPNWNDESTECKYIVLLRDKYGGLGNKMMAIVSSFLYALLTGRVLLVQRTKGMEDIFCEPFPHDTWILPLEFPIHNFSVFNKHSPQRYKHLTLNNTDITSDVGSSHVASQSPYIYIHMFPDDEGQDIDLFSCDEFQNKAEEFTWVFTKTQYYFVPLLFLTPSFKDELSHLFPEKDTIFHHLGRYLFHPTNAAWGFITRYYQSYLSKADEMVGIQIRVFNKHEGQSPLWYVLNQVLSCSFREKLLPEVNRSTTASSRTVVKSKAVMLTSLSSGYFETIRDMYWEHPTYNGEIINVYQPSNEKFQQSSKKTHNMKAWSEMYLLSLSDILVTSARSTFGYAAQGLGGLNPWILFKPNTKKVPDPPCRLAMSMEPCFHHPPLYACKDKKPVTTGALASYTMPCEDDSTCIKLVNRQ